MESDNWQTKIDQYVDAELSTEDMRAMEAHLRGCASCAAVALRHTRLKHVTKMAGKRYFANSEFRRRVQQQISVNRRPARRWGWIPSVALAVAVILIAALSFNILSQRSRSQQLLTELADLHVTNLASSNPVEVVSSDRHTVKPWFQGKLPFTFDLPELEGTPFSLLGGRLTYLDHAPGAHLIYNVRSHHISVFIFQEQPDFDRTLRSGTLRAKMLSFNEESWSAGGLRYFVFGDASPEYIQQLSGLLKRAASPKTS